MAYAVPRPVVEAFRKCPGPVLYLAGSFNPPHAGHLEALKSAAWQLRQRGHVEPPILVVAPKSDERLKKKMEGYGDTFMFPWSERVKLFQKLIQLEHCGEVHFDEAWRHFRGEATQIRRDTDRAFGALGCQIFRVMGEDRVRDHGLEDDPWVLSTPRSKLSSTGIRKLLALGDGDGESADELNALVGPKVARVYMQSFATL
ncbi:unnamed protein product [Effrenium voratum]|uniref:Cytidyltransferase-like domain-containing protein n=1 Tax=Effrenium voratum TaxID=2562239 RepID=A0AA36N561_9DINO|nr:unnamed protein product [Effrenium voratum]CAJ1389887.1 unnamed protein product [Effrenium voratum]CAJ1424647.1 unnamed protein product [Effrenium voratum]